MERKSSTGTTVKRVPGPKTGPEAMAAIGMPKEFAAQLMLLAQKYGVTIAIRASMPEQKYRDAAHPKPSDVKYKTGDWGLTKGVIAEDPQLGKHDAKGLPTNTDMKHSERVATALHRIALRYILKGLQSDPPTMQLMNQDDIAKDKLLLIKCLDAPQDKRDYIYKIDLASGVKPIEIETEHMKVMEDSPRAQPEWWSRELGNFASMLEMRLPVECQKKAGQAFQPVKILAIRNDKGELLPITGDMDLLWISRPDEAHPIIKSALQLGIPLLDVMDLFRPQNIPVMRAHLQTLCKINDTDQINFALVTDDKLGRMGSITPFEAYMITIINQRFATFVDHLDDLLQHGCENRNPGKTSSLDSGVLHCMNGLFILTTSEKELLAFIVNDPEYLQNYRLELNPNWDMGREKWGRVVARILSMNQYDLGQPVMEQYRNATGEDLSAISAGFRKVSRTFLGAARRLSMTLDSPPTIPQRRNSGPLHYIVQIECPDFKYWDDSHSLLSIKNKNTLAALCQSETNNHGTTWKRDNENLLVVTVKHEELGTRTYQFKIDTASISQVAGEFDDNSISVFKILRERFLPNDKIAVNSPNEANKLALEYHLQSKPPSPNF